MNPKLMNELTTRWIKVEQYTLDVGYTRKGA